MICLYNTLTKTKELINPIKPNLVTIYICGVTTYDLCHLGHGRTFVAFDIIIRHIRHCGYKVRYIRNITDIDDKVIYKAVKVGVQCKFLSKSFIVEMHKDFKLVNVAQPNHEPCTTKTIRHIIDYVYMLIKKRYAYLNTNGEVIYSIKTTNSYGLLSRQAAIYLNVNKLKNFNNKRTSNDFVLWKRPKPGEPSWDSPWGIGRPGWHIECSAINHKYLASHFDIHGGGLDLIFPHHENELTQTTSCFDGSCVRIWMHTGILILNKEKMSKSLENSIKLRDVFSSYDAETIRALYITSHYRSPLSFSLKKVKEAVTSLKRLYTSLRTTRFRLNVALKETKGIKEEMVERFINAMNDDFNTPKAFSILFYMSKRINYLKHRNLILASNLASNLRSLGSRLGLLSYGSIDLMYIQETILTKAKIRIDDIEKLIKKRNLARSNKQWHLSDNIRAKLIDKSIVLEDVKDNTIWNASLNLQ
ncbi:cysteine--tRNA ligase [Candidatus Tremblaya phenacola]|uniref:Cysteine--tRNA ligase n=1 Tax=Candidatus Tremblayella phenacoccinincola TaxID=1010676 RepID=A0A2G0V7E8_9PROT|nr:cysteine--tRNA ligase [Candidatus Tremblaya phenacola]PHN16363.1 Cysteine--tRNA ligase [Candidatus Tremblaya phenacola]